MQLKHLSMLSRNVAVSFFEEVLDITLLMSLDVMEINVHVATIFLHSLKRGWHFC